MTLITLTILHYITLHYVFAVQLAWMNISDVEIQAHRSSDGRKLIVAKEHSDLHIVCKTLAGDSSVEWTMNTFTALTTDTERVEMSESHTSVNGKLTTLHTLVIRHTSTMDIGTYECHSDSEFDRVYVKITKLASLLHCLNNAKP